MPRRKLTDAAAAARFVTRGPDAPAAAPASRAMLSVRLPPDVVAALRLAAVTNQNRGQQPDSVQAIVLDAVQSWLAARKS